MGFDVSAHPVDVQLIQSRLLPYLKGQGSIDDLVAEALRLTQVRYRANAWGLGVLALLQPGAEPGKKPKRVKALPAQEKTLPMTEFDSNLHVWGRPFFITVPSGEVTDVLNRYLAATPEQADALAREQIAYLSPALVDRVRPDAEGSLPPEAALAAGLRSELDFLRESHPHVASGKPVKMPDGEKVDPEDLFLFTMPLAVVSFAAHFTPGWMGRGYEFTTSFLTEAGLDADGLVEPAGSVFEPLLNPIGGWEEAFEPTITQNYTLGGYVRAANVPLFRTWWEAHKAPLLRPWEDDGNAAAGRLAYQKVHEALADAQTRRFAFLEATEVYSGFQGLLN